jgi:hypothetical protein
MESSFVEFKKFSEVPTALIFIPYNEEGSRSFLRKLAIFTRTHGVMSQKTVFIMNVVRSWNMIQCIFGMFLASHILIWKYFVVTSIKTCVLYLSRVFPNCKKAVFK